MTGPVLERAAALAGEARMLPPGTRVLCALSGGADSVCLLHWLAHWPGIAVAAAHFNHRLRGAESDRDEAFVRDLCRRWEIPLTVGSGDVAAAAAREGLSTEEAARILRYAFLEQTARAEGCGRIATAHNAEDNAETILFHLVRGTGLAGLAGIPPRRGDLIRPLLTTPRAEILAYLEAYDLPHVEDSTNTNPAYARNKLRHQVLPLLREINPQAVEHMGRAAALAAEVEADLEADARRRIASAAAEAGRVTLPWSALEESPGSLRPRMVLMLLDRLGVGRKDFGAVHLEGVLGLTPGARLDLPRGVTAFRAEDRLVLRSRPGQPEAVPIPPGGTAAWGGWQITLTDQPEGPCLALPAEGAVTAAPCPPGERLQLPGSKGPRTVKRLCLDRGISLEDRDRLPAFYVDGRLAAVWGLGTDERALPEGAPRRFIQIERETGEKHHGT